MVKPAISKKRLATSETKTQTVWFYVFVNRQLLVAALSFPAMRAVVQRVTKASVTFEDSTVGSIGRGLLVLLGVSRSDTVASADYMAEKLLGLRIFDDHDGKMNLSIRDVGGAVLVVSQFTLFGDVRRGKRPSFDDAARPEAAKKLYEYVVTEI